MLKDLIGQYYFEGNYNCAESILRAGNDYYGLQLHDRDMIMIAACGAGIQTGATCGALLAGAALLSIRYVEAKAHESADIKAVVTLLTNKCTQRLGGSVMCDDVKPRFFEPGVRCLATVEAVCDIIEETIAEYDRLRA